MPKILFVHENYPAQFGGLAGYLAAQGWDVTYATAKDAVPKDTFKTVNQVRLIGYRRHRDGSDKTHRYLHGSERAVLNGQGFARTAIKLQKSGYDPDIIVAHSGWGSGSFAKSIWPHAKFVQYLEWWYDYPPRDRVTPPNADDEFDERARATTRNLPFLLDWINADGIIMPTQYQAAGLPEKLRQNLLVLHDGVDTEFFSPASSPLTLPGSTPPADAPVLTYATRGMEPYRGFPQFMAAVSELQKARGDFHCIIGGEDSIHYGPRLPKGDGWKKRMLQKYEFDMTRLHFPGRLPLPGYRDVLRRSDGHIYLTIPFVLSWSMIEAMATACPLITNDCAPTREAVPDDSAAQFVNFTDPGSIMAGMEWALDNPARARAKGQAARARALDHYNAAKIYPQKRAYFERLL